MGQNHTDAVNKGFPLKHFVEKAVGDQKAKFKYVL